MKQLHLPGMENRLHKIVNVASVKHRSPFRYPGGKTWLVPLIMTWLSAKMRKSYDFFEPFAGGAIVGLSVAFEDLARHVTLIELDYQVAAVWEAIIETGEGDWLAEQILHFDLTPVSIEQLFARQTPELKEEALKTIIKNRINRGGILAHGAGRIKEGENGKGMASRWYPKTLARRIQEIAVIKDRLSFIHGDGLQVIEQNRSRTDVALFVDPPYTVSSRKPGKRLYDHFELDHERLFRSLSDSAGDFLMTYDNAEEVRELARKHNFDYEAIPMKNSHHAQLTELLIGRDLYWLPGRG